MVINNVVATAMDSVPTRSMDRVTIPDHGDVVPMEAHVQPG